MNDRESHNNGEALERRLADVLLPRGRLLTAFSGGIDSTLVAAMARRVLGREAAPVAVGDSPSLPRRELEDARRLARDLDLELIEIRPGEQDDARYQANAGDRCYYCKSHLYDAMQQLAADVGIRFIANGSNLDDQGDYRPGLRAAAEAEVISPLMEAAFDKAAVRTLAAHLDLPNADKPASACLASRIAYGTPVTPERLDMVEQAENLLRGLGLRQFRVRHHELIGEHQAALARIEVPGDDLPSLIEPAIRERLVQRLSEIGYAYVSLDLAGFRSGSGNVLLGVSVRETGGTSMDG